MTDRGRVYKGESPLCGQCRQPLLPEQTVALRPGDKVRDETGEMGVVVSVRLNEVIWEASCLDQSWRGAGNLVRYVGFQTGEDHVRERRDLTLLHGYLHIDPVKARVF